MAFRFVVVYSFLAVVSAGIIGPVTYAAAPAHKVIYANPSVDAVASTHQNVVRSFGGTVATDFKTVDTPYSSVRKANTRITNNVYTAPVSKTLTYTPAYEKTVYAAPSQTVSYASPSYENTILAAPAKSVAYAAPVYEKAFSYATPAQTKTLLAPASPSTIYSHAAPLYHAHQAPSPASADYFHAVPEHTETVAYAAPAATKTLGYAQPAQVEYNHGVPAAVAVSYKHGPANSPIAYSAPGVSGYGTHQTVHYSPAEMVSHMSFEGFGTHWGF